jgi:hypothetical protein
LPDEIGTFDIALMGAVLLHTRAPLQIVEECGKRSNTVIIADRYIAELEGQPVCRLIPTAENADAFDSWWFFSTAFFTQFLGIMGFATTYRLHLHRPPGHPTVHGDGGSPGLLAQGTIVVQPIVEGLNKHRTRVTSLVTRQADPLRNPMKLWNGAGREKLGKMGLSDTP